MKYNRMYGGVPNGDGFAPDSEGTLTPQKCLGLRVLRELSPTQRAAISSVLNEYSDEEIDGSAVSTVPRLLAFMDAPFDSNRQADEAVIGARIVFLRQFAEDWNPNRLATTYSEVTGTPAEDVQPFLDADPIFKLRSVSIMLEVLKGMGKAAVYSTTAMISPLAAGSMLVFGLLADKLASAPSAVLRSTLDKWAALGHADQKIKGSAARAGFTAYIETGAQVPDTGYGAPIWDLIRSYGGAFSSVGAAVPSSKAIGPGYGADPNFVGPLPVREANDPDFPEQGDSEFGDMMSDVRDTGGATKGERLRAMINALRSAGVRMSLASASPGSREQGGPFDSILKAAKTALPVAAAIGVPGAGLLSLAAKNVKTGKKDRGPKRRKTAAAVSKTAAHSFSETAPEYEDEYEDDYESLPPADFPAVRPGDLDSFLSDASDGDAYTEQGDIDPIKIASRLAGLPIK